MRRFRLLWGYWLAIAALLIGTMFLCSGFLRGPGKPYLLLPFPLIGLLTACIVAVRKTPPGASRAWQAVLVTGAFGVLMCMPTWLWWGWLEWKVRNIPVPTDARIDRRSTGGVPFDGRSDYQVWFEQSLAKAEIDALPRPGEEWRVALEDYRSGVIEDAVAFYEGRLTAEGWQPMPDAAASALTAPLRPERVLSFARRGERLTLSVFPNTFEVGFLIEPEDPYPPFGRIWLPGPPWLNRPTLVAPPTPAPTSQR